jgi:BirA family transcriptional regulator, biotin operon repressor / biotin---[acetyl-CoA-carboxylase] ligase
MIIGSKIIFLENLTSTNSWAIEKLRDQSLQEGTIIRTDHQSAGRGYSSNKWESEKGKNLLFSIILYPPQIKADRQFLLSMSVSLGICDCLDELTSDCKIKWPNDIYVNNDKIAGILIESAFMGEKLEHCVVGIGLNVNQTYFSPGIPNPVSLKILSGRDQNTDEILSRLATTIEKRYLCLVSGQTDKIAEEYVSRLYLLNEWASYRDDKATFHARLKGVNEEGKLKLERKNNEITEYGFKEVEFVISRRSSL